MTNYIISSIYILFFMASIGLMAVSLFDQKKQLLERIIYSYLIYKFFTSFFGVIVQFFKLSFSVYCISMILTWIGIYAVSLYKLKTKKIKVKNKIIPTIKTYWFTLVVALICIFFSMANIEYQWMGNHLDDGLYVNTVADYTHDIDTFKVHAANGLKYDTKFGAYSLNTWQLESGFYSKILNIEANVFLRFAQSFILYLLFAILIVAFVEKLLPKETLKKYRYHIQFIPVIMLLFMFQFNQLNKYIILQDGWQFGSAIFYGSTMIRTMGIFLLLLPIIDKEKLKIKDFIIYMIISFILLSQSAVGLPVVSILAIAILITYLVFEKVPKKYAVGLIVLITLIGVLVPNNKAISDIGINLFISNYKKFLLYVPIVIILVGYFFKNKKIIKMNTIILLLLAFVYIPEINDITESLSMYTFVEARYLTGVYYSMAVLSLAYGIIFLTKFLTSKKLRFVECSIFLILMCGLYLTFKGQYGSIINLYKYVYYNKSLVPESTVVLGSELEKIHKEKNEQLYVLTPDWVLIDGYAHSVAVLLRQYSPSSSVISAIPRYSDFNDSKFKGFNQSDCDNYNGLMNGRKNYNDLVEMLDKYPINCIVSTIDLDENIINKEGFSLENKLCTRQICYFIYTK